MHGLGIKDMVTEKTEITFTVNGQETLLTISADETLLDILREKLKLMGTKKACGVGECGACTVIMDGKAINSCLVLASQVDGSEVITIEGLAKDGKLDALQQAFLDGHVVQCGFCTPGMLMSAKALLISNPNPTKDEIREAISGNMCRCSDYSSIIKAIEAVTKG
jgi:aerobic-type carbon monoxide dehydrogenase small subunit (CoxS/CutS family)